MAGTISESNFRLHQEGGEKEGAEPQQKYYLGLHEFKDPGFSHWPRIQASLAALVLEQRQEEGTHGV